MKEVVVSGEGEDKQPDDWRYVRTPAWLFDKRQEQADGYSCVEDEMIAHLDGVEEKEDLFDGYEILSTLSEKEAKVVEMILYDGLTFREVGEKMGYCKQNIHRLYRQALVKLKGTILEMEKD